LPLHQLATTCPEPHRPASSTLVSIPTHRFPDPSKRNAIGFAKHVSNARERKKSGYGQLNGHSACGKTVNGHSNNGKMPRYEKPRHRRIAKLGNESGHSGSRMKIRVGSLR